jgi:hypothetical protein
MKSLRTLATALRRRPIEQPSKAADNGVTAGYIREIQSVGFTDLSLDQIAKAADEKVHPLTRVR